MSDIPEHVTDSVRRRNPHLYPTDLRALSTAASLVQATVESELHYAVLEACKQRGWLCFHGSMAHRTRRVEGEPDCIILADAGRLLLVELKTKTGKLSPAQQATAAHAAKLGHTIYCVRSLAEFEVLL